MADLRKKRTEAALYRALMDLLLEENFDKITVKMIVDKALINRNTFYLHYQDKYELLSSLIQVRIKKNKINWAEFIRQPFVIVGQKLKKEEQKFNQFIRKQRESMEFREIWINTFLEMAIKNLGNNDDFWFTLGKVRAIIEWDKYHNNIFSIMTDYEKLQKIFDTEKFPKLF